MMYPQNLRSFSNQVISTIWVGVLIACLSQTSQAIIFHSTPDPTFNTNAPTGDLAESGWELQGRWGSFLGTPIAPNLFITARHVGGAVGGVFSFRGVNYTTIDSFADSNSDLRIHRVCGTFPEFATLYEQQDELGKSLVVFGRGTQRGTEVTGDSVAGPETKGWKWGAGDGVIRWGENIVTDISEGGTGIGDLIAAAFDADGSENEGHLSSGDSGGALFIKDNGTWKLAGINYAVDGPFNTSTNGGGFNGAIFDQGGLYTKPDGVDWEYNSDSPADQPSSLYATRISGHLTWILGIIDQYAGKSMPVLQSTSNLGQPFTNHSAYDLDEVLRTITIDAPTGALFLRISDCDGVDFVSMEIKDGKWILSYGPQ